MRTETYIACRLEGPVDDRPTWELYEKMDLERKALWVAVLLQLAALVGLAAAKVLGS